MLIVAILFTLVKTNGTKFFWSQGLHINFLGGLILLCLVKQQIKSRLPLLILLLSRARIGISTVSNKK
jgi:hypothetical protein